MRIFGLPLVCLALAASSLTIAHPVAAVELTCLGKTATITHHRGTVTGTPDDDLIVLTGRGRVIARDGNDLVCGSLGADLIVGATGTDKVIGGHGTDSVLSRVSADQPR
jgi:hypothetical protein